MMGWIGNIFIFAGLYLVAYKKRSGLTCGIVGNSLWLVKGVTTGQPDLVFIELVVVVLQAFAWNKWGRD